MIVEDKNDNPPFIFEIQFHTPDSYRTKEDLFDDLFQKYNDASDDAERKKLYDEIIKLWDQIPSPEKSMDIKL
jgi:hypothetical protein